MAPLAVSSAPSSWSVSRLSTFAPVGGGGARLIPRGPRAGSRHSSRAEALWHGALLPGSTAGGPLREAEQVASAPSTAHRRFFNARTRAPA
eukprot:5886243-Alexandrium_andersonii.AAC.1